MGHAKISFYHKVLHVMVLEHWEGNGEVGRDGLLYNYFYGKSLVGKTCIWGTFKFWHFNPWLQSLELPFAWWHLKLDHLRPPCCQTAAILAKGNSWGKERGCLLKRMSAQALYHPKQAAAFKRFLLSCRDREGELFQDKPEKNVLKCVWEKNTYFLKDNNRAQW